nr:MAG TPA: MBDR REGULATOR, TETR FAMILY [Caudoviricetes sp.]
MRKYKLKKKRFKSQKLYSIQTIAKRIIDFELRPYNVTIEDVTRESHINGEPWYTYYKFKTKAQEDVWNDYCNKLLRKHMYPWYISKRAADEHLSWVRLSFGLTSEYLLPSQNEN